MTLGVHERRLADAGRPGEEDDAVAFVQHPQQGDELRRDGVALDQIDGCHGVGGVVVTQEVRVSTLRITRRAVVMERIGYRRRV